MKNDEFYKEHLQEIFSIADINTYSEEDIEHALDRLLKCLPNNGKLYKYRSIEGQAFDYAYDGLKNGYLWMAKANTLNDDLDCALMFDPIKEIDGMKEDFFTRPWYYLDNWVKANIDQLQWGKPSNFKAYTQVMECVDKETWELDRQKAVKTLVKNGSKAEQAEKYINELLNLVQREVENHSQQLKDVTSSIFNFNDINREDTCVCSFSEIYDSTVMWGLYANSSKGFCIEYDYNKVAELPLKERIMLRSLYKVIYEENLPEFSFKTTTAYMISEQKDMQLYKKANEEMLTRLVTKTSNWMQEKEWRIVLANLGKKQKIYADIVSGIIIDERVLETDNAKKLIALAKEKYWTIKIRKKNYTGTKHIYEELKEC